MSTIYVQLYYSALIWVCQEVFSIGFSIGVSRTSRSSSSIQRMSFRCLSCTRRLYVCKQFFICVLFPYYLWILLPSLWLVCQKLKLSRYQTLVLLVREMLIALIDVISIVIFRLYWTCTSLQLNYLGRRLIKGDIALLITLKVEFPSIMGKVSWDLPVPLLESRDG